jgi:hypothetical protein
MGDEVAGHTQHSHMQHSQHAVMVCCGRLAYSTQLQGCDHKISGVFASRRAAGPHLRSGMMFPVRVTMPLMATRLSMSMGSRSRMARTSSRLKMRTWQEWGGGVSGWVRECVRACVSECVSG